jgi:hypothetical protein
MKILCLLVPLLIVSCQKDDSAKTRPVQAEKVVQIEDELESFAFVSNIKGLDILGEKISKEGDLTMGEEIKIFESSSKKMIDEFPELEWGRVGFKIENDQLHVYPHKSLEIIYSVDDANKVIRKTLCQFKNLPLATKFDDMMVESKKNDPVSGPILSQLGDLAKTGDQKSYNFFMKPNPAQKEIIKKDEDTAASITKSLDFMRKNGCPW